MLEKLSRQQLGQRVHHYPYSAYHKAILSVFDKGVSAKNVGFHSDVYFVRAALEKQFNIVFPLQYVEALMIEELGWKDRNRRQRR